VLTQITPESAAAYLRKHNHKVQPIKSLDGRPMLLVQIQHNGWQFDMEIEFTPDLRAYFLICPLGKAGAQYTGTQLMELLKANYRFAPAQFCIRATDQCLCFEELWANANQRGGFPVRAHAFPRQRPD